MEDMIRDRLVCGMWNTKIQQCCLVETELNFDRALKIASAVERNKKMYLILKKASGENKAEGLHKVQVSRDEFEETGRKKG